MESVLDRFELAIGRRTGEPSRDIRADHSTFSERVTSLFGYVLMLHQLGPNAVKQLQDRLTSMDPKGETAKWFVLALGYCGEKKVADRVLAILKTDPDPYVRCIAIKAYARSAGQRAIPLLEQLLNDNFVGGFRDIKVRGQWVPVYPIREAAQDALMELRRARSSKIQGDQADPNRQR